MAIVPPGNKQVGEYTGILTVAMEGAVASNYGGSLEALVRDPANSYIAIAPKNVMVGEYAGVATLVGTGAAAGAAGVSASAVVHVNVQPAAYNFGVSGAAVVKHQSADPAVINPKNLMVGEYAGVATLLCEGAIVHNSGMSAEVVVQQITSRVETVLFNLTYPEGFTG